MHSPRQTVERALNEEAECGGILRRASFCRTAMNARMFELLAGQILDHVASHVTDSARGTDEAGVTARIRTPAAVSGLYIFTIPRRERIGAVLAAALIGTGSSVQRVVTVTAPNGIRARSAHYDIIARPATHVVVTTAPEDAVLPSLTIEAIAA